MEVDIVPIPLQEYINEIEQENAQLNKDMDVLCNILHSMDDEIERLKHKIKLMGHLIEALVDTGGK